jgi:hypothetical protein
MVNRETFRLQEPRTHGDDIFSSKRQFMPVSVPVFPQETSVPFERGSDLQRLSRRRTRCIMGRIGFFDASTDTVARSSV